MTRSEYYPYPPRPGSGSCNRVDINLDVDNQPKLGSEEQIDVIDFENRLYSLSLDSDYVNAGDYLRQQEEAGMSLSDLETIWSKKINIREFGLNYFLTEEGQQSIYEISGVRASSVDEVAELLCGIDWSNIDSKTQSKLVAKSVGFEEKLLTEKFTNSGFKGTNLESPLIVSIYTNPEVLIEKARGYRHYNKYISSVREDLLYFSDDNNQDVLNAKLLIVDLYSQRINKLISATYINAFKFLAQQRKSGEQVHQEIVDELEDILPAFSSYRDKQSISRFLQRMDRFRYGVSVGGDGSYTWISPEAQKLYRNASEGNFEPVNVDRGNYEEISPNILKSEDIDGVTFGNWISEVLEEYGYLSKAPLSEWNVERQGPASDGKWQVIVSDEFKSLEVNNRQKTVFVPSYSRSLESAVKLANHEITHVIQAENKQAIGNLAILEMIGIDTALEQSEAGGKWQEKIAEETLNGIRSNRLAGTGYLKALAVKSSGGTYGECVEVYFKDLIERNPHKDREQLASEAVNRARRIFRSGGLEFAQNSELLTNTQPLHYLEQQLIYENLIEQNKKLLFIGGVAIANLARLVESGLVDISKIKIPNNMPVDLLFPKVKKVLK